jgi:hypothetical protein
MQRSLYLPRTGLAGVAALALICAALATGCVVGGSGQRPHVLPGRRRGVGMHARIYGYSLGHPFPVRKATRGGSRTFRGEVPAPLFFEVCTYQRTTEVTCTRKWTHN